MVTQRSALAVKKLVLTLSIVAVISAFGTFLQVASGQAKSSIPHRVALVDVGYIFAQSNKFKSLRADWTADFNEKDKRLKEEVTKIRGMGKELEDYKKGSSEYLSKQKEILQVSAQVEAERKENTLDLARKESQFYQEVYAEIAHAVRLYAEAKRYTLVLRFNRADETSDDPQKVVQTIQKMVVFHQDEDDITSAILKHLNSKSEAPPSTGKKTPNRRTNPEE